LPYVTNTESVFLLFIVISMCPKCKVERVLGHGGCFKTLTVLIYGGFLMKHLLKKFYAVFILALCAGGISHVYAVKRGGPGRVAVQRVDKLAECQQDCERAKKEIRVAYERETQELRVRYEREIQEMRTKAMSLESEMKELKQQVEKLTKDLVAVKSEKESLRQQLQREQTEKEDIRVRAQRLSEALDAEQHKEERTQAEASAKVDSVMEDIAQKPTAPGFFPDDDDSSVSVDNEYLIEKTTEPVSILVKKVSVLLKISEDLKRSERERRKAWLMCGELLSPKNIERTLSTSVACLVRLFLKYFKEVKQLKSGAPFIDSKAVSDLQMVWSAFFAREHQGLSDFETFGDIEHEAISRQLNSCFERYLESVNNVITLFPKPDGEGMDYAEYLAQIKRDFQTARMQGGIKALIGLEVNPRGLSLEVIRRGVMVTLARVNDIEHFADATLASEVSKYKRELKKEAEERAKPGFMKRTWGSMTSLWPFGGKKTKAKVVDAGTDVDDLTEEIDALSVGE
jgi:hypothetical protein